jgi:uncharacterized protein (UPF0332 family)
LTEDTSAVVEYRMNRARATLVDARVLAEASRWNACMNRLYYSCFYAVSALLIRDGLSSSKHSGVRGLFNRHYVRTGQVSKDLARLFNDLFERRQEADYLDFLEFERSQVEPLIPRVEALIADISALLEFSRE